MKYINVHIQIFTFNNQGEINDNYTKYKSETNTKSRICKKQEIC